MYTEDQLLQQIKALGIEPTDTLIVHTSLKSIGALDTSEKTGAEVLISALRRAVPDGLLLIPAFTYSNIRETPIFDLRNTMPCVGAVPCMAVQLANRALDCGDKTCLRSMHPSHSVVAFGKNAQEYVKDDRRARSPVPIYGSIGKLRNAHGKILLIGVDMTKTTFIHAVDEYRKPEELSAPYPITFLDGDGNKTMREARNCRGPASSYGRYEPSLQQLGGITYGQLGDATTRLISAKICFDAVQAFCEAEDAACAEEKK